MKREVFPLYFLAAFLIVRTFFFLPVGCVQVRTRMRPRLLVPYDLVRTISRLDRGFNREVYTRWMLRPLKAYALHKAGQFPGLLDTTAIQQASTFQAFDDTVTAPFNGFANARDYWSRVSSALFLDKIRMPVLLIHADNDSFCRLFCCPMASSGLHRFSPC